MKSTPIPANIDAYISAFPKEIQDVLAQVRSTIQQAAPEASETISYAIPTFVLQGPLVYFAAFKNHIGLYALPSGTAAFQKELAPYKSGKGSVQFPLNQPMPLKLITRIVQFRVAENNAKAKKKKHSKKSTPVNNLNKANNEGAEPSFLESLSAPARRALEAKDITTLQKLARCTQKELLELHGVGKTTLPKLTQALATEGLQLKK